MSDPTTKPEKQLDDQQQAPEATEAAKRKLSPEELDDVTGGARLPDRRPAGPFL